MPLSAVASQTNGHGLRIPLDNPLNSIQARLQSLHPRSVGQADEVMAGTVKEVTSLGRIEVEEYARYDCAHMSIQDRSQAKLMD